MAKQKNTFTVNEFQGIRYSTPFDIIKLSQSGLTKEVLLNIAKVLNLTQKDMAEMLAISLRTFQRYAHNRKLNHIVSEHVLQLIDVIRQGSEVFSTQEEFVEWLYTPNTALDQRKPIELLKFRVGCQLVTNLLGQIKHGIVA